MDTQDIDWSSSEAIIEAAKPFDRNYDPSKPVMLAGSELVAFVRHHWAPRSGVGRRASDSEMAVNLRALAGERDELLRDLNLLRAENEIFRRRLMKDRRQTDIPVSPDRRAGNQVD